MNRFRALSPLPPRRPRRDDAHPFESLRSHERKWTHAGNPQKTKRIFFSRMRLALSALTLAMLVTSSQAAAHTKAWCADRCDQIVIDWNLQTHQVIKAADGYSNPMAASRTLAMVHLAMHDAVNAAQPRYRTF